MPCKMAGQQVILETCSGVFAQRRRLWYKSLAFIHFVVNFRVFLKISILVEPQPDGHISLKPGCNPLLTLKVHIDEWPLRSVPISHDHVPWCMLVPRCVCKPKGATEGLLHASMGEILVMGDVLNVLRDARLFFGVAKVILPPNVFDLDCFCHALGSFLGVCTVMRMGLGEECKARSRMPESKG